MQQKPIASLLGTWATGAAESWGDERCSDARGRVAHPLAVEKERARHTDQEADTTVAPQAQIFHFHRHHCLQLLSRAAPPKIK